MKDRRAFYRKELNSLYIPVYDALCDLLPPEWQPYSGYRTFQEQAEKWAQGRTKPGDVVTKARPGMSAHNYGCATDWTVWEGQTPEWPDKDDPIWMVYLNACQQVGVRCLDFERMHNELWINESWSDVHEQFENKGMDAALEFIRKNMRR